jgi:transposase-like protein
MMANREVRCPQCGSGDVVKYGKKGGVRRYACRNEQRDRKIFRLEYKYGAYKPGINKRIIDMAINASGIRDTARVLGISTYKVMDVLKKNHRN